MKANLIVLIAVPGAGKSTFARNFCNEHKSAKIVSRDEIRFNLVKEDDPYFSKEKQVFNSFINEIKKSLKENEYTIADATHLNEASRSKLLKGLGTSLDNINVKAVMLNVDLDTAIARNENRKGTRRYVPEEVISSMFFQLTVPSKEEGFNDILIIEE